MTLDGIGKYLSRSSKAPGEPTTSWAQGHQVNVVCYPGRLRMQSVTQAIITAGCAMVNCMPVFIARGLWNKRCRRPACPSSATTSSRRSARRHAPRATSLFRERSVHLDRRAGERRQRSDFMACRRGRLSRRRSKTNAVTSCSTPDLGAKNVRRAVGLRAVADRPQVGVHPPRGSAFGDVPRTSS